MTDLVICGLGALAVAQIVEVFRHSELFEYRRALAQLGTIWDETKAPCPWLLSALNRFAARVFVCSWCLSVHVGIWVATWLGVAEILEVLGARWLAILWRVPIVAFAISRLSNIINDVGHEYNRTPKTKLEQSDV